MFPEPVVARLERLLFRILLGSAGVLLVLAAGFGLRASILRRAEALIEVHQAEVDRIGMGSVNRRASRSAIDGPEEAGDAWLSSGPP